jgi:hypothetical protein
METSGHILSVVPLGLFYNGFSVEDDTLTTVLCDIINRILTPFSYSDIISDENKVDNITLLCIYGQLILLLSLSYYKA